jgi:excisionase family DNA binding protein
MAQDFTPISAPEEPYTSEEAALLLAADYRHVLRMLESGVLVGIKTGDDYLVTHAALKDFQERRSSATRHVASVIAASKQRTPAPLSSAAMNELATL